PWTIPANLGISLHPNIEYHVVEVGEDRFVIASELVEAVAEELEWATYEVVQSFKGNEADKVVTQHPFYDRDSIIMLGEHVTTDAGTGCVHTAPGHGEDDFYVAKGYGIDALCPVDETGFFTNEAPGFEGVFYDEANKAITE